MYQQLKNNNDNKQFRIWTADNKKRKNNEPLTKAICNKGFSSNSSILTRSNFGVGGQFCNPQSLTAYSLKRCDQYYSIAPNPANQVLNRPPMHFYENKIALQ